MKTSRFDYSLISEEVKATYVAFDDIDLYDDCETFKSLEDISFDILHKVCDLSNKDFDGTNSLLSSLEREVEDMMLRLNFKWISLVSKCISKVLCSVSIDPDTNDDSTSVILSLSYLHRDMNDYLKIDPSRCNP